LSGPVGPRPGCFARSHGARGFAVLRIAAVGSQAHGWRLKPPDGSATVQRKVAFGHRPAWNRFLTGAALEDGAALMGAALIGKSGRFVYPVV
jgi:hypothetical protein